MAQLVAGAESSPRLRYAIVHVDYRTFAKADDLGLAIDKASIMDLGTDTERNRGKVDVLRVGDSQID
ncbi:hypothetical protein [Bradyrhizobium sp. 142]|uniref:hypothetical protein n=1 Tax=Bradyrhizobium sp. 142 TaxID=2782618 RepID=UPI001FFB8068